MDNLEQYRSAIRVRLSANDAHYGGQLVNGAHMLSLFGDVATELAIKCDGDEGLLVGYESIEFLAPLLAGDFIEATGRITRVGRKAGLLAHRPIGAFSLDRLLQGPGGPRSVHRGRGGTGLPVASG